MRPLLFAAVALLAGCGFNVNTPVARVQHGPARGQVVDPLAALPVICVAEGVTYHDPCVPEYRQAVATMTRMAMELQGYGLVDSELLNAETRRRSVKTVEGDVGATAVDERVSAGGFLTLTPAGQRELLSSIGARGVLLVTIRLGAPRGMAAQRTVTVTVTVNRLEDNALAWRSRCSVETGDYHATERAIDLAARCALDSEALF